MSISYGGDYITDTDGGKLKPSSSVMRNRIINGAMVIDQRNAGASVTPASNGLYNLDRWGISVSQGSKFSVQQNAGSVTPPAGFTNYLGVTSVSAYTVGSGENFAITQAIEGYNFADMGWGTADAKTVTLSFWVRSSLTGTFGGALLNSAQNRSYVFSYTINSANTWEQKTITIAGDTTGTWVGATNGIGVNLFMTIGAGSNVSKTAGSWGAGYYVAPTGQTSIVGTNGATFYITGVQLEVGSSATGFEYENYTSLLQKCQRYFYAFLSGNGGGAGQPIGIASRTSATQINASIPFPVTMRTAPTLTQNTGSSYYQLYVSTGVNNIDSFKVDQASTTSYLITNNSALSGMTPGQSGVLYANNASCYIGFTAEL